MTVVPQPNTAICECVCHLTIAGEPTMPFNPHNGSPCWCYGSQAPVLVTPPTFCPHCGKRLDGR